MNNAEDFNKAEHGGERIPTREDVLAQIQKRCERAEVIKELSDENGVYFLEASEAGEKQGEFTLYAYQRAGTFDKNSSAATVLQKIYFEDDIPFGGDIIAEYDSSTGSWIEK